MVDKCSGRLKKMKILEIKKQNNKGFTLVDLVIVIAVIAILAGVLIGTFARVIATGTNQVIKQLTTKDE